MTLAPVASNWKAGQLFLLATGLAVAWFGVNFLAPGFALGPTPLRLVLVLLWNAVLLYGLWSALNRLNFSPGNRITTFFVIGLVLTFWITGVWVLAVHGFFQRPLYGKVPTLPIAIFLPLLPGALLVMRSRAIGSLLDATPPHWLVGFQVYRILGAMFLVYLLRDNMPAAFALPAGIGDVATGVFALPAALWVASGSRRGNNIGIRWNWFGLTDFAVAITMGMLTSPGPANLLSRDHPNLQLAQFPTVITPAFVVPFSALLHLLSLRQLKRRQSKLATAERIPSLIRELNHE